MEKEKRIYEIHVGHLEGKDVKEYMENVVKRFKNVTTMGPGIVYAPYVPVFEPGLVYSEDYIPKQKILKVKEWLRFQTYGKKSINKDFYTTFKGIPEINLKMESRTIETEVWKIVDGVATRKIGKSLELTKEESDFNAISEKLKKTGI